MADRLKLQVFLRGGLGNQLFQYSTGLYLAENFEKELVLRTDLLPISKDEVGGISRWPEQISGFRHSGTLKNKTNQPENSTNLFAKSMQAMRMLGDLSPSLTTRFNWLASETKYRLPDRFERITLINSYSSFKDFALEKRSKLREQLSSLVDPSAMFLSNLAELKERNPMIVHVRRGDYIRLESIYGNLNSQYYSDAVEILREQGSTQRTWIFTDSPDELPKHLVQCLEAERVIGPKEIPSPLETLVLMSKGSAIVGSNSTFSWWAGLISQDGNPLVAPKISSAITNNFSNEDERVPGWKVMNVA
jgi:hypothetical protein